MTQKIVPVVIGLQQGNNGNWFIFSDGTKVSTAGCNVLLKCIKCAYAVKAYLHLIESYGYTLSGKYKMFPLYCRIMRFLK